MSQENHKKTIAIAIIEKDGKILIAQRSPKIVCPLKWGFPGGKVESGESLCQAVKRELAEELGIAAEVGGYFGANSYKYDDILYEIHVFKVASFTGEIVLNEEHIAFAWVEPDNILGYDVLESNLPFIKRLQKA